MCSSVASYPLRSSVYPSAGAQVRGEERATGRDSAPNNTTKQLEVRRRATLRVVGMLVPTRRDKENIHCPPMRGLATSSVEPSIRSPRPHSPGGRVGDSLTKTEIRKLKPGAPRDHLRPPLPSRLPRPLSLHSPHPAVLVAPAGSRPIHLYEAKRRLSDPKGSTMFSSTHPALP